MYHNTSNKKHTSHVMLIRIGSTGTRTFIAFANFFTWDGFKTCTAKS